MHIWNVLIACYLFIKLDTPCPFCLKLTWPKMATGFDFWIVPKNVIVLYAAAAAPGERALTPAKANLYGCVLNIWGGGHPWSFNLFEMDLTVVEDRPPTLFKNQSYCTEYSAYMLIKKILMVLSLRSGVTPLDNRLNTPNYPQLSCVLIYKSVVLLQYFIHRTTAII